MRHVVAFPETAASARIFGVKCECVNQAVPLKSALQCDHAAVTSSWCHSRTVGSVGGRRWCWLGAAPALVQPIHTQRGGVNMEAARPL